MSEQATAGLPAVEFIGRGSGALRRFMAVCRGRRIRAVTVWNYLQLLGGSVGRLGLSLVYFLLLTRSLALADFGFFAGSVAVGTILARLAAFGYGANLLQVAATRPRTLGPYMGIFLLWMGASLPVCAGVALLVYRFFLPGAGSVTAFLLVIASDAVIWRMLDAVSVVNSGLGRFGYAAAAYNIGTAGRAGAALAFLPLADHGLDAWAWLYFIANLTALVLAGVALLPRVRPRYRRGTALLRWRNALALGGAGLAGSAQVEIDKMLALTFGGAVTAGLYAVCIRVIDLTAVPTRSFNVLMIQRVLTNPGSLGGRRKRMATEIGIALASTAAFAVVLVTIRVRPGLLGQDIASASGLLALLWAVPAFRNLTEYQIELLYAHGRMAMTLWISLLLTAVKATLMALVFVRSGQGTGWVLPVNGVFLVTYAVSACLTYRSLAGSARPERPR